MIDRLDLSPAAPQPAPNPTRGIDLGRIAIVDVLLPFVAVAVLERWGAAPLVAYAAASLFPAGSIVATWFSRRQVDIVGVFVLVGIASGLATALLSGDPRFALLRAAPGFALFGLACLASLPARRPLMFFVGRAFSTGGNPAARAAWDARLALPGFRRAMRFLTLVWGAGALAATALKLAAAFLLPGSIAIVTEPIIAVATVLTLLAYTRGFARRAQSRYAQQESDYA